MRDVILFEITLIRPQTGSNFRMVLDLHTCHISIGASCDLNREGFLLGLEAKGVKCHISEHSDTFTGDAVDLVIDASIRLRAHESGRDRVATIPSSVQEARQK